MNCQKRDLKFQKVRKKVKMSCSEVRNVICVPFSDNYLYYSAVMKCCSILNHRTAFQRRPPSESPKRINGVESLSMSESSNLELCDIWASQERYMLFSLPREL